MTTPEWLVILVIAARLAGIIASSFAPVSSKAAAIAAVRRDWRAKHGSCA